jgi:hypothetical protein
MNRKSSMPSPASSWRARFLEIARQAEAESPLAAGRPSGLRSRSRMAGFAVVRLGRRAAIGPRA